MEDIVPVTFHKERIDSAPRERNLFGDACALASLASGKAVGAPVTDVAGYGTSAR